MGNESRASRSRYIRSMWSFIRTQPFLQPVERNVSEYLRSQGATLLYAGSINTCFISKVLQVDSLSRTADSYSPSSGAAKPSLAARWNAASITLSMS